MKPVDNPAQVLKSVRKLYSQKEVATHLGKNPKTISRWERGISPVPKMAIAALRELTEEYRVKTNITKKFTFIDLFAGIGGFRIGFEAIGGECVYTSEWDNYASKTYLENHGRGHPFDGDITEVDKAAIPDHDLLLGGFPCQPFSLAGVSKKNSLGRAHGFQDETQGTLFFDILEILRVKRPSVFVLENVKNLLSHDRGRTFKVICGSLGELGYDIHYRVINARHWLPQHRERVFIVGFSEPELFFDLDNMAIPDGKPVLKDILHKSTEAVEDPYTVSENGKTVVNPKYTLSDRLWQYLQDYAEKHRKAGNGFGYSCFDGTGVARTLSARYHKDGSEILISQPGKNPRRLTPRECARLMGFDQYNRKTCRWERAWRNGDEGDGHPMVIPVSDTRAYKMFGNAVAVPVVKAVAEHIMNHRGIGEREGRYSSSGTLDVF